MYQIQNFLSVLKQKCKFLKCCHINAYWSQFIKTSSISMQIVSEQDWMDFSLQAVQNSYKQLICVYIIMRLPYLCWHSLKNERILFRSFINSSKRLLKINSRVNDHMIKFKFIALRGHSITMWIRRGR